MNAVHAVEAWMARHARRRLIVVSPHLDDAVYSAFSILSRNLTREVATVVTAGRPGVSTAWSTVTGFPDSEIEHRVRCDEDAAVLADLGVAARRLGILTEDRAGILEGVAALVDGHAGLMDQIAWLLPAGAGRLHSRALRILRRILRRPAEAGAHPEHLQVRDVAVSRLSRHPAAIWGFYADLPYAWQEPIDRLLPRLAFPQGAIPALFSEQPEARSKCVAAAGYRSQAGIALGTDPTAQMAFCARPESFILG